MKILGFLRTVARAAVEVATFVPGRIGAVASIGARLLPKPAPPTPSPIPHPAMSFPVAVASPPASPEDPMNPLILSVFKKFFASSIKALLVAIIAALSLAAGAPAPTDAYAAMVWTGLVGLLHALISALGRVIEHAAAGADVPKV